jgi:hypothetical protein
LVSGWSGNDADLTHPGGEGVEKYPIYFRANVERVVNFVVIIVMNNINHQI